MTRFLSKFSFVVVLLLGFFPTFAFAQTAPLQSPGMHTSSNWSGYVAIGSRYNSVQGSWVVPSVSATNTVSADAAWVGIGGVSSTDLIQAGTEAISEGGTVTYEAWYELLPSGQVRLPLSIHPGDRISTFIAETSPNLWSITIINATTGERSQSSVAYTSSYSSVEWIEEMPMGNSEGVNTGFTPLDSFGSVNFSGAYATENGSFKNIVNLGGQPITMAVNGQTLATPSALSGDGASFSVSRSSVALTPNTSIRRFARIGRDVQTFNRGAQTVSYTIGGTQVTVRYVTLPFSMWGGRTWQVILR